MQNTIVRIYFGFDGWLQGGQIIVYDEEAERTGRYENHLLIEHHFYAEHIEFYGQEKKGNQYVPISEIKNAVLRKLMYDKTS